MWKRVSYIISCNRWVFHGRRGELVFIVHGIKEDTQTSPDPPILPETPPSLVASTCSFPCQQGHPCLHQFIRWTEGWTLRLSPPTIRPRHGARTRLDAPRRVEAAHLETARPDRSQKPKPSRVEAPWNWCGRMEQGLNTPIPPHPVTRIEPPSSSL